MSKDQPTKIVSVIATVANCTATVAGGTYQPRPSDTPGTFKELTLNPGKTSPDKGHSMTLSPNGGRFWGYTFAGVVEGGNFTFTPQC